MHNGADLFSPIVSLSFWQPFQWSDFPSHLVGGFVASWPMQAELLNLTWWVWTSHRRPYGPANSPLTFAPPLTTHGISPPQFHSVATSDPAMKTSFMLIRIPSPFSMFIQIPRPVSICDRTACSLGTGYPRASPFIDPGGSIRSQLAHHHKGGPVRLIVACCVDCVCRFLSPFKYKYSAQKWWLF